MMARFKGRSSETYRIDGKPIGEGFKFFAIVCAETGFVWHVVPYGRLSHVDNIAETVINLVNTLPHIGQKLYVVGMDNYFTYPKVVEGCRKAGVAVVGTARARKGWPPKEIRDNKDDRFNTVYFQHAKENFLILRWVDNNVVTFVSTTHKPEAAVLKARRRPRSTNTNKNHINDVWGKAHRATIKIPQIVDDYNMWMGGVDKADQFIAYYRPNLRCRRTWMPVMLHWLNVTRINMYIAHLGLCQKTSQVDHKAFLKLTIMAFYSRAIERDQGSRRRNSPSVTGAPKKKRFRLSATDPKLPESRLKDTDTGPHVLIVADSQGKCRYCSYRILLAKKEGKSVENMSVCKPRKKCLACDCHLCKGCFDLYHAQV